MSSTDPDLEIRSATDEDAGAIADVLVHARRAAVPLMPEPVHSDQDAAAYVRTQLREADAWVAEIGGGAVGFALTHPGWLDMLYVLPEHAGRGVGSALLELVKHQHRTGFSLWVFESNTAARRFYRARGLVELERTAGAGNEEGAPDIRMAWPGHDPMAYLRGQIDEVDADLAAVIARRVALTREIQHHKDMPGHAGRDPAREAEIAEGMAWRAPVLTVEEWRRIVHEVITASLDAAERGE